MLESAIERRFVKMLVRRGALALKQNPNPIGLPDRLVLLPGGRCIWVELKRDGEEPRPSQVYWHDRLRRMGQEVRVVTGMKEAVQFVEEVTGGAVQTEQLPAVRD